MEIYCLKLGGAPTHSTNLFTTGTETNSPTFSLSNFSESVRMGRKGAKGEPPTSNLSCSWTSNINPSPLNIFSLYLSRLCSQPYDFNYCRPRQLFRRYLWFFVILKLFLAVSALPVFRHQLSLLSNLISYSPLHVTDLKRCPFPLYDTKWLLLLPPVLHDHRSECLVAGHGNASDTAV
jgi:hypothetical protein